MQTFALEFLSTLYEPKDVPNKTPNNAEFTKDGAYVVVDRAAGSVYKYYGLHLLPGYPTYNHPNIINLHNQPPHLTFSVNKWQRIADLACLEKDLNDGEGLQQYSDPPVGSVDQQAHGCSGAERLEASAAVAPSSWR